LRRPDDIEALEKGGGSLRAHGLTATLFALDLQSHGLENGASVGERQLSRCFVVWALG
jgi:hypothetical protein